jgi:hypothetical protein
VNKTHSIFVFWDIALKITILFDVRQTTCLLFSESSSNPNVVLDGDPLNNQFTVLAFTLCISHTSVSFSVCKVEYLPAVGSVSNRNRYKCKFTGIVTYTI